MAEHLVRYLRTVLAEATGGHRPFQIVSDEEVAAMDDGADSEFGLLPWVESLEDVDRRTSARFGERSLFLRGLLVPAVDEQDGRAALVPSEALRLTAEARRLGAGYIMMRSTYDGTRSGRYLVLQPEAGGFEEDIDGDGIHVYSACTYAAASKRLAEYALPHVDHNGPQTHTRIPATHWQRWLINELGIDTRPVQVNVFLPGPDGALEPDVWLVAHAGSIGLLATREGMNLNISSMTQYRLEQRIAERISTSLKVDPAHGLAAVTPRGIPPAN